MSMCGACLADNPAYNPGSRTGSDGQTGTVTGTSEDPTAQVSTGRHSASGDASSDPSDPKSASSGTGSNGTSDDTSPGADTSTSTEGKPDASSSSTGGLQPSDLGQPCGEGRECGELYIGAECCDAVQCADRCMVPCASVGECPFDGMGCEHGYCLFPCADNDADCAPWPGATCQHGGLFCEVD